MRRGLRSVLASCALVAAVLAGLLPVAVATAPPASAATVRAFGAQPFYDILTAADANKKCGLNRDQLAALMLAPIFPEAGGTSTLAPSPMTLSRWDMQAALWAFGNTSTPYQKAFYHPGVGMWQFDSAGGWNLTAADAINTQVVASTAAKTMADRYCASNGSRSYVWAPWYGCGSSTCESIYNEIYDSGNKAIRISAFNLQTAVTPTGGMVTRTCTLDGTPVTCHYVDPAAAQGNKAWTSPGFSSTPITAPFYDISLNGREWRVWLKQDTGYDATISADKPITANARTSLVWKKTTKLCDQTAARGSCGRVAHTAWGDYTENTFGSVDGATGGVGSLTTSGWAIDPDTNDPIQVHLYVDGVGKLAVLADRPRGDVAPYVPGYGENHGYQAEITGLTTGSHEVCAYAINVGPYGSVNTQIGCKTVTVTDPAGGPYSDVSSVHPFVADIQWLADENITIGYPDGTFRPTDLLTREAMAGFLWRAAGEPAPAPNAPTFSDVPSTNTFATAIAWLAGEGISLGYPDGTFRPSSFLSREEMAGFLWRAAAEPTPAPTAPTFIDVPPTNGFATAISWLAGAGITMGYADGTFRPANPLTRQAMAAFLHRADPYLF